MHELWKHYANLKKSNRKSHRLYDLIHINIQSRNFYKDRKQWMPQAGEDERMASDCLTAISLLLELLTILELDSNDG